MTGVSRVFMGKGNGVGGGGSLAASRLKLMGRGERQMYESCGSGRG